MGQSAVVAATVAAVAVAAETKGTYSSGRGVRSGAVVALTVAALTVVADAVIAEVGGVGAGLGEWNPGLRLDPLPAERPPLGAVISLFPGGQTRSAHGAKAMEHIVPARSCPPVQRWPKWLLQPLAH